MRGAGTFTGRAWRVAAKAALVVALALFAAGRWTFRRLSPHFEDFV